MSQRKYLTEFAINMNLTHCMLVQQDELKSVKGTGYFDQFSPCHIYMICKRQRITLDPNRFSVNDNYIILPFKIQNQSKYIGIEISAYNEFKTNDIRLLSNYPYNYFELLINERTYLKGKASLFLHTFGSEFAKYLDLEVLYIGQSYGVDGARTAPERLINHSTLQSIYAEAINKNPDCEIWIVLTSFEQYLLSSFDGTLKISEEENNKDQSRLLNVTKKIVNEKLNEQQVINFTEAALIKYFSPPFNVEYKNSFPNPAHTTYSECYDLDINSILIELNTKNINCRLYSQTVEREWIHFKSFFLHSREDRKSLLEFGSFSIE